MKYQVENNMDIFRYLYSKENNKLFSMFDSDLVHIMITLKKYYLELRNKLNIDTNITFAGEIEFEEAHRDLIELFLYNTFPIDDWIVKDNNPISNGGYVLDNTSAHVHIGMNILGNNPKYWRNFALLWMTYENIITRFLYREYIS